MMLDIDGLTHEYGDETAVEDISFGVAEGELVALLGPSGCGKTTIIQAIAGHVRPTSGIVSLRGMDVTTVPPETRRVSIVFQRSTLYPHMTVGENVAYGLKAQGFEHQQRNELINKYLELVSLAGQREAYPTELSGGQQRRVELARALAPQPDVLLLDEPLSALDRTLRDRLRDEIARIQRETGVTTLFITHDQEDAMAVADRLIVMNEGTIAGTGSPRSLYESPANPFVASFLGRSNTFTATIIEEQPLSLAVENQEFTVKGYSPDVSEAATVTCYVRSEHVSILDSEANGSNPLLWGEVTQVADIGRRYDVAIQIESGDVLIAERTSKPPAVGDTVAVEFRADNVILFGTDETDHSETFSQNYR